MAKPKPLTLEAVANQINAHLKRFASDPEINRVTKYDTTPYYFPMAVRSGRYVTVRYVSYHGNSALTREEAERYLAWLDAGNIGKHFQMGQLPLEPEGT